MTEQRNKAYLTRIWQVLSHVKGVMPDMQLQQVAIAFTFLRRIDCLIGKYAHESASFFSKNGERFNDERLAEKLCEISGGYPFFNYSGYTFKGILTANNSIEVVMNSYIQGFSKNVQEILDGMNFNQNLAIMQRQSRYLVELFDLFSEMDMSASSVDNEEFLELISSLMPYGAREMYTPQNLSNLICECLLAKDIRKSVDDMASIYDPVCGTGNMLANAGEKAKRFAIHQENISLYGQDVSSFPSAIAKALVLLSGNEFSKVCYGNTLTDDQFPNHKFQYILADMPLGLQWRPIKERIEKESYDADGRFSIGLPSTSDSQFLFIEHILSKMHPDGSRAAFISTGNVLRGGTVNSGESRIRRWLFENDMVETIMALPGGLLAATSIPVYLWILSSRKEQNQIGKVRLIDLSIQEEKGSRLSIGDGFIKSAVALYKSWDNSPLSMIVKNEQFGCYEVGLLENGKKKETVTISLDTDIEQFVEKERQPYAKGKITVDYSSVEKGYSVDFGKFFKTEDARIDSLEESSKNLMSIINELNDLNSDLKHLINQTEQNTISKTWKELPLHAATKAVIGFAKPIEVDETNGLPLISVSSLRGYSNEETRYTITTRTRCSSSKDALIIVTGANSGEVFRGVEGIVPSTLAVVKCTDKGIITPEYLYYLLKGYERSIQLLTRGAAIKSLNMKQLSDFKCLIPPVEEQLRIAAYLDGFVGKLDRIIASLNSKDSIISAYRQTLIENIVRGIWSVPAEQTKVVEGVEYIDLGLPSGTKWSSQILVSKDEEGIDNSLFSYEEALKYSIPTVDQFKELIEYCETVRRSWPKDENIFDFVGTSGKKITFDCQYYEKGDNIYSMQGKYRFWLKGDAKSEKMGLCATDKGEKEKFKGNRFPILLVH